jgi:hypothetical protein
MVEDDGIVSAAIVPHAREVSDVQGSMAMGATMLDLGDAALDPY